MLLRKKQNNIVKDRKILYNEIVVFGNLIFLGESMKKTGTKKIITERLVLKKMKLTDYFCFKKWFCDPRVSVFSTGKPQNTPYDSFRFLLQRVYNYYIKRRNKYYFWGLYKNSRMIGFIEIRALDFQDDYWIYYMISPEEQSKGYATEMLKAVLKYMKTQNAYRLFGACDTENKASYRVLEKSGMTYINHKEDMYHYQDGRVGAQELFVAKYREER